MKLFLRYQLSGTVFLAYFLLFFYFSKPDDLNKVFSFLKNYGLLSVVFSALLIYPLGAFVHQVSVLLKNYIVGKIFFRSLDDYPEFELKVVENLEAKKVGVESVKLLFQKLSDLNSFFYVRYDMGFVAPVLAYVLNVALNGSPCFDWAWVLLLMGWSFVLLIYIPRLAKERLAIKKSVIKVSGIKKPVIKKPVISVVLFIKKLFKNTNVTGIHVDEDRLVWFFTGFLFLMSHYFLMFMIYCFLKIIYGFCHAVND